MLKRVTHPIDRIPGKPGVNAPAATIVALASGAGRAGVGVIRISGARVQDLARALIGRVPSPRVATLAAFVNADGAVIDRGIALYFPAPRSFTGEDVLELHAHGGPVVLRALIARALELGARHARAGEFSERAYVNGKLDLTRAEAIADLIGASSAAQARAAARSLDGAFASRVEIVKTKLVRLRVYVEAAIDFPDEEIDFLADGQVLADALALIADIDALLAAARRGARLRDGLHVVLIGRPNAGKSSVMNRLAGRERAIVTAIPGTTRDLLTETVALDGAEIALVDTAGLREAGDAIEAEGIARARAELGRADLALVVIDASALLETIAETRDALAREIPDGVARLWLANQIDRIDSAALANALAALAASSNRADGDRIARDHARARSVLAISAKDGSGFDALAATLAERAGADAYEGAFSARQRHVDALVRVRAHAAWGADALEDYRAGELLAEELRLAQRALDEITGVYSNDELLGAIFSSFCIGK